MTAEQLERLIRTGRSPLLLDVRSGFEFHSGHIAVAVHAPLLTVGKIVTTRRCRKEDPVVITCEHGPRAQLARALLRMRGYRNVELLDGHMANWRRSGRAITKGRKLP